MTKKYNVILYFALTFIFSYGLGLIFKDRYLLGSTSLFLGFIQNYFMARGKWFEKIIGIFSIFASTIVCLLTGLFGSAIFSVLVYIPLSIFSLINWKKHKNIDNNEVTLNKMTWKKSIFVIFLVTILTALLTFLLSLIPSQKLAIFDAAQIILNISGMILIALRFKEGWIAWILCNLVSLATWITALMKDYSSNAIMMIVSSSTYIVLNIWGFYSFIKLRKIQETNGDSKSCNEIKLEI